MLFGCNKEKIFCPVHTVHWETPQLKRTVNVLTEPWQCSVFWSDAKYTNKKFTVHSRIHLNLFFSQVDTLKFTQNLGLRACGEKLKAAARGTKSFSWYSAIPAAILFQLLWTPQGPWWFAEHWPSPRSCCYLQSPASCTPRPFPSLLPRLGRELWQSTRTAARILLRWPRIFYGAQFHITESIGNNLNLPIFKKGDYLVIVGACLFWLSSDGCLKEAKMLNSREVSSTFF